MENTENEQCAPSDGKAVFLPRIVAKSSFHIHKQVTYNSYVIIIIKHQEGTKTDNEFCVLTTIVYVYVYVYYCQLFFMVLDPS